MITLSDHDIKILEALATYQFLTTEKLVRLGIGKSEASIRNNNLKRLARTRPALIQVHKFGGIPGIGRLHSIYHLTEQGAKAVADYHRCDLPEIVYPRHGLRFQNDYFHRMAFVDFHIGLRQWVEADDRRELEFFHSYYTKGSNRRSVNQYQFQPSPHMRPDHPKSIEPDGVFRFSNGDQTFLCAMELHRKPDAKYITDQLNNHMTAIDQQLIAGRFDHPTDNLVLSVHDSVSSFRAVQKRLQQIPDFGDFVQHFHFNLVENVRENFGKGWITSDEKFSYLF